MNREISLLRHHPWRVAIVIAVIAAAVFWFGRGAFANSLVGPFEIEGAPSGPVNAVYFSGNDPTGAADDWVDGDGVGGTKGIFELSTDTPHTAFTNCYGSNIDIGAGISEIARFMCDGFGKDVGVPTPENNLISPSGKIPDDKWPVKAGSLGVPKDDLSHGYYLQRVQNRSCNSVSGNHNIIIVGFERGNNEGANHWGVELNAVPPTGINTVVNNTVPAADFVLDFNRTVGDVFVSVDLEKGGTVPTITVFQVTGFVASGSDAGDAIFGT